jgi:peptidoglycan/LPS O-acetylase OafA/YrhL
MVRYESLRYFLKIPKGLCLITSVLLPSFVWHRHPVKNNNTQLNNHHPTRFLDGLRGIASLIVVVHHFSLPYQPRMHFGFGYDDNLYPLQLPVVRLLYSGFPMVAIFYTVSGYVLSNKPTQEIRRNGASGQLLHMISSSIFRRGIRLSLPAVVSTFLSVICIRLELYPLSALDHPEYPRRLTTFQEQFWDWQHFVSSELMNPWTWTIFEYKYDPNLWTIAPEFRSSMLLFLAQIALARAQISFRLAAMFSLASYCMCWGIFEAALFLIGALIVDLDQACREWLEDAREDRLLHRVAQSSIVHFFWIVTFLASLYLASYPDSHGPETSTYAWIPYLDLEAFDNYRCWQIFGSVAVVWSVSSEKMLQSIFLTPVALYLGKVSYSMYLCHGPILRIVERFLISFFWEKTGKENSLEYGLGFGLALTVSLLIIIWVADIFWRLIDMPVISLARWVDAKCSYSEDKKQI